MTRPIGRNKLMDKLHRLRKEMESIEYGVLGTSIAPHERDRVTDGLHHLGDQLDRVIHFMERP